MYTKILLDGGDSQRGNSSRLFKVGIAVFGGSCLVLLSVIAISAYSPSAAESATSLIGMSPALRAPGAMTAKMTSIINQAPGVGPWMSLALAGIQDANQCSRGVSTNANVKNVLSSMNSKDRAVVQAASFKAEEVLKAGQFPPLGFWDPLGLSANLKDEGQLLFYREAELKHGRVCMLATLGFVVAEKFHPLFGGNIDVPSAFVGTTELAATQQQFWLIAGLAMALPEILPAQYLGDQYGGGDKARQPGDLGFDPLGLKPKNEKEFLEMQNKELANGRLAMIAFAGAISQELVTGQKLFG